MHFEFLSDVDDCEEVSCNNGTCEDLTNGFRCECNKGFSGKYCEIGETFKMLRSNFRWANCVQFFRCLLQAQQCNGENKEFGVPSIFQTMTTVLGSIVTAACVLTWLTNMSANVTKDLRARNVNLVSKHNNCCTNFESKVLPGPLDVSIRNKGNFRKSIVFSIFANKQMVLMGFGVLQLAPSLLQT